MEFIPFVSITALYFLIALIKPYFQPKLPFNLCAICSGVSATWLILLILWLIGYKINEISIGILMGMSIAGIMYNMELFYKKKKLHNFWLARIVIIVGGFYLIEQLLQKNWHLSILLIIVTSFAIVGITTLQGATHKANKLDDCC